jgi:hypothetical protein
VCFVLKGCEAGDQGIGSVDHVREDSDEDYM